MGTVPESQGVTVAGVRVYAHLQLFIHTTSIIL